MREQLAALDGRRIRVTATFGRFGVRPHYGRILVQTMLLTDLVLLDGTPLAQHVWLTVGARFGALDLHPGDAVAFDARVAPYTRDRVFRRHGKVLVQVGGTQDYQLTYPTRIAHTPACRAAERDAS